MAVLGALLIAPHASIAGGPQHSGKAARCRTLTDSEETTTSKCIGKPVTPICAVETFVACAEPSRKKLCAMVSRPNLSAEHDGDEYERPPQSPPDKLEYTVVQHPRIMHLPCGLRSATWIRPDDVEIDSDDRSCPMTRRTCAGEPIRSSWYAVRHVGDHWIVIDYWSFDRQVRPDEIGRSETK